MHKLEEQVKSECTNIPKEILQYQNQFTNGQNPAQSKKVPTLNINKKREVGELPSNIGDDWSALTIANAIDFEEKKKNDIIKDKITKKNQRAKFDLQMEERRVINEREIEQGRQEVSEPASGNKKKTKTKMKLNQIPACREQGQPRLVLETRRSQGAKGEKATRRFAANVQ